MTFEWTRNIKKDSRKTEDEPWKTLFERKRRFWEATFGQILEDVAVSSIRKK